MGAYEKQEENRKYSYCSSFLKFAVRNDLYLRRAAVFSSSIVSANFIRLEIVDSIKWRPKMFFEAIPRYLAYVCLMGILWPFKIFMGN